MPASPLSPCHVQAGCSAQSIELPSRCETGVWIIPYKYRILQNTDRPLMSGQVV